MKFLFTVATFFLSFASYAQIIHLPDHNADMCRQYNGRPRLCEQNRGCSYDHRNNTCEADRGHGRIETLEFDCESIDYRYRECPVRGNVVWATIVRQYSKTDCLLNRTFGRYGSTIWVNDGCRARFQVKIQR